MIIMDFLLIFLFAAIMASVLNWGLGWRHPAYTGTGSGSAMFLFMILLLAMWAAGSWLEPWGPVWRGSPWLNFLAVGLLVSLLVLAIAAPTRKPRTPREAEKEVEDAAAVGAVFGLFFWLLLIGLGITGLVGILS